jgi:ATP adenylyltransferase
MVAPNRHVSFLDELDGDTSAEIMLAARALIQRLREIYHPHGFNVGFNLGEAAGAGIEEHMHLHIVPRWRGDTNMMTVIGKTRVHPEDSAVTYARITGALREHMGDES